MPPAGGVKVPIVKDEVDQAVPTAYPPVDRELFPSTPSMADDHDLLGPARPVGFRFVVTEFPALFLCSPCLPPPSILDDLAGSEAT
jgi:hypothetical protein